MKLKNIIIYIVTVIGTVLSVLLVMTSINYYKAKKMVSDFDEALSSSKQQMIFYARKTCYYCQLQKPILKQVAKDYNLEYVNIDTDLLSKKQIKHITTALGIDGSTPVTAIVKNKKVLSVHVGYLDGKEYVDFLISANVLPETAIYKPEKNLTYIDYNDFLNLKEGILVLGAIASTDAIDLRKALNNIASKYNININYLNLSQGTKEEYYDIIDKLDSYNINNYNIKKDGNLIIPLVYIIKDSKIKAIIESNDEKTIVNQLKKNNIIK